MPFLAFEEGCPPHHTLESNGFQKQRCCTATQLTSCFNILFDNLITSELHHDQHRSTYNQPIINLDQHSNIQCNICSTKMYKIREHMVICCLNISTRRLSFVSSDDLILVSDIIPKVALWAEILSKLRALPHGNARLPIDSIDTNTLHIQFISSSYPVHIHFISISYPVHIQFISISYPFHIHFISISYPFHIHFISIHPVKEGNMTEHVWDRSSWSLATSFAIPQSMLCSRNHTRSCHKLPIICTFLTSKNII